MNPYTRSALIGVPALTVLNPWGLAIARLGKSPENRSWPPPRGISRLFIHAGKGDDRAGYDHLARLGHTGTEMAAAVERSAIIAVADIAKVCHVGESGGPCECPPEWAARGQVHWVLDKVVPLAQPIPCQGRLRLWYPDRELLDAAAESLALLAWEPLVCRGRNVDGQGRAHGGICGDLFFPNWAEPYSAMVQRARTKGWKVAPRPADGGVPDAMCRACALPSDGPTALEQASLAAANRTGGGRG